MHLGKGKTEERELKAGEAVWSDGVKHATENTGTTESRALVTRQYDSAGIEN
jgi:hypothetical protein